MTDRRVVRIIHDCLKDKSKWYIDLYAPEVDSIQTIAEKAKEYADDKLNGLSTFALYMRYRVWRKSEPFVDGNRGYFNAFLDQVVFDLGRSCLKGTERYLFEQDCYLTHHFIK
jgi:hypothetical protein